MPPDFQECLQGGGSIDPTVWRSVTGDVISDLEDPGRFPPQCGPPAVKYAVEEGRDGQADLSAAGRSNVVSGATVGRDVCTLPQ